MNKEKEIFYIWLVMVFVMLIELTSQDLYELIFSASTLYLRNNNRSNENKMVYIIDEAATRNRLLNFITRMTSFQISKRA